MRMHISEMPGIKLIMPRIFQDARGYFSETYNKRRLADAGIFDEFVQDNQSYSAQVGTIRGLHFQKPPVAQAKLVRVSRGRILDVAVDLRRDSPTFGSHVAVELSDKDRTQLFVPVGFAHGFCTLEPDTEVIYKVTQYYAPQADSGVLWSDQDLSIEWPITPKEVVLSDKDARLPQLADLGKVF